MNVQGEMLGTKEHKQEMGHRDGRQEVVGKVQPRLSIFGNTTRKPAMLSQCKNKKNHF